MHTCLHYVNYPLLVRVNVTHGTDITSTFVTSATATIYTNLTIYSFVLTFHASIRMRWFTHPTRTTIVYDLLRRFVTYDIAIGLFVHQLDACTHLIRMRLRLTWCTDMFPNWSAIDFGCLHGHRNCTLLHANVTSVCDTNPEIIQCRA